MAAAKVFLMKGLAFLGTMDRHPSKPLMRRCAAAQVHMRSRTTGLPRGTTPV